MLMGQENTPAPIGIELLGETGFPSPLTPLVVFLNDKNFEKHTTIWSRGY